MFRFVFWFLVFALIVGAWLLWALVRPTMFRRRIERALREFVGNRLALEAAFCKTAAASGKPRGLAWKKCDFQDAILLGRDRANGEIVGLVGVTISFEAIEGGGMEDIEAVGNLRAATAVFTYDRGEWKTQGRAVFNLEPREVLERYRSSLDPISDPR